MADHWQNIPHEVVLCNFGGPSQESEVEPFLIRLFEDPFIIRAPLGRLRPWLARRIARKRAPNSNIEYQKIGYSPINRLTEEVRQGLEARLRERRPDTNVLTVNRYTAPFASDVVGTLNPAARRFVLTLYPHFCHSTVASSLKDLDLAYRDAHGEQDLPATRIYSWWHHQGYIDFTVVSVKKTLKKLLADRKDGPVTLMYSAHGIPVRYHQRGDPYCHETRAHSEMITQQIRNWLKAEYPDFAPQVDFKLCYQSRVGPVEWVKPYTEEAIVSLGKERGGTLVLVPLSFTSDHIETLYEMDVTYKELALEAGFVAYDRVPPANDDPLFVDCLADLLHGYGF